MSLPDDPGCTRRRYRLPREEIKYVRFIVEAYGGIAVMSSRAGRGEIEWLVPLDLLPEADALAAALAEEIGMQPIT